MGALVAFELARALRASGAPQPIHLLVAGRQPPQMPNIEPPIGGLPDDEFLAEVRRLNGTVGRRARASGAHAAHDATAASGHRRVRNV